MSNNRQRTMGSGVQTVIDYLKRMQAENSAFFYAIQSESDQNGDGNIFWADASCKFNYNCFGDSVVFDTAYRINGFRVPFAAFTGVNHHGQPVLFGCALILNESESSFVWLFQTWLQAMSGKHPVSITTDPDRLIQIAISQIFPATRHRFNMQGIFRETQEKMAHVYQSQPTFEIEFKKCVDQTETIDEFESCWQTLLQRFYVMDNEWLRSMYNARQQWVPVYMRNTFFGGGFGDSVSYFDGFVNESTTIQVLVKQYEKAVANWHDKELKADYDTVNTMAVLKTPSPMEKQAAELYTRKIFMKFQEELVETLANTATKISESGSVANYRVAKFGEEQKAHNVSFNSLEIKASCSCQMFEYTGIICRHVLAVFRTKNVLKLPPQYVLKRWTRNAKSGDVLGEPGSELGNDSRENLTVRYNNLRQEAVKYVEEGAKSIYVYNVAMDALQEASKKVSAAKNKGLGGSQGVALSNGNGQEFRVADENRPAALQSTDEKEKKIRELTLELESTNQRCEVYRANLLGVLKDMEEQKLKLSVKVQNAKLSLKD